MKNLQKSDTVTWNTPQGKTTGTITKKITSDTQIQGHSVKASNNEPQYEVKSDKTGKKAIHKPESLDKK